MSDPKHSDIEDSQIVDTRPSSQREAVSWCPAQIAGREPVIWNVPRPELVSSFKTTLDQANDEKPLQKFFEDNPDVLLTGIVRPHTGWVIPRHSLPKPDGGSWVPDFVICEWTSVGPDWYIVELESPKKSPLKKDGDASQICNHAADQINSYRAYIEQHGHILRGYGWPKLHGQAHGIIVIGRRSDPLRMRHPDRLRDFRRQQIEVMSYDRLFEKFQSFQAMLSA